MNGRNSFVSSRSRSTLFPMLPMGFTNVMRIAATMKKALESNMDDSDAESDASVTLSTLDEFNGQKFFEGCRLPVVEGDEYMFSDDEYVDWDDKSTCSDPAIPNFKFKEIQPDTTMTAKVLVTEVVPANSLFAEPSAKKMRLTPSHLKTITKDVLFCDPSRHLSKCGEVLTKPKLLKVGNR